MNKYKSECRRLAGIANNASSLHNPNKNEDSKTKDVIFWQTDSDILGTCIFREGSSQFNAILVINTLI